MNKTTLPEGNLLQYEKSPYLLQHAGDPVGLEKNVVRSLGCLGQQK